MSTGAIRKGGLAMICLAAVYLALFMFKGDLAAPPPVNPDNEFNTERAVARLSRILGDEAPHPVDSEENDNVRDRLLTEVRKIGFDPSVRDDFSCRSIRRGEIVSCARVRNVVFKAGPDAGPAILVASHYDSVAAGPGASDDGAGMAAALEIAAILKARRPVYPVIFLFTDGEEQGLLGAHSFVRKDPLARTISAVINMEARGTAGPAILFETSEPNGRDLEAVLRRTKRPVGNSLATDIYKMLPNDTDMTEFLALDIDATNFAFSERLPLYHTPGDNLANLDRRSLSHIGTNALAALDGFLRNFTEGRADAEGEDVFADVFSRFLIVMPQPVGAIIVVLGLAASAAAFFRIPGGRAARAALTPLVAIAGAALTAFILLQLVSWMRQETSFWFAEPHWTRAVIYLSAIAASFGALYAAKDADRRRILAAAWFWFSFIGVIAYAVAPGSALLFGVPAGLFACAALASAGAVRLLAPLSAIGAAASLALWLTTLHHAEIGLGLGAAWPFAGLGAMLFMLVAPMATPRETPRASYVLVPAAGLFAAVVLAATTSAYSPAAPRPLNIQHFVVARTGEAFLAISPKSDRPPTKMSKAFDFADRRIDALDRDYLATSAKAHDGAAVGIEHIAETVERESRRLDVRLRSNGADEVLLAALPGAGISSVNAGGEDFPMARDKMIYVRCVGRACADFNIAVTVGNEPAAVSLLGVRNGLGPVGAALAATRPAWASPVQGGDIRLVVSETSL
jgi:hypothetical protein